MSKDTGKAWSQGYRRIPNTSKYLAGDPDIRFYSYTSTQSESENSSDSEASNPAQHPAADKLHLNLQNSDDIIEIDDSSVNQEKQKSSSCTVIPQPLNDLPLSPDTRQSIIDFVQS